jgi:hypothetical protein
MFACHAPRPLWYFLAVFPASTFSLNSDWEMAQMRSCG